jgi:hypothetical protein
MTDAIAGFCRCRHDHHPARHRISGLRLARQMEDRNDVQTEPMLRRELQDQVRAPIVSFRAGRIPQPDVRHHRQFHSDSIRREFA